MKNLMSWLKKVAEKMSIWDIAAVKIMAVIFGLVVGLFMPKTYRKIVLVFCLPVFFAMLPIFLYRVFLSENKD